MKKILFTVENYYPQTSGVPVVVKYLAEGVAQKTIYEVHVATRLLKDTEQTEIFNNVFIHRFHIEYNNLKKATGEISNYITFILNGNFDCIILECTQCVTTDVLYPFFDQLSAKIILHSHGFSGLTLKPFKIMGTIKNTIGNTLNYYIWKYYYNITFPLYINKIKQFICLSTTDNDYRYLQEYNATIDVISNATEEVFFNNDINSTLEKYVDELPNQYAICVAYYNDVKNQLGILEEYYKTEASSKMGMVFIGTEKNSYYRKLSIRMQQLEAKYGHRCVHLLTDVKRQDIPGAVANAKMYLCGSKREAFSISLIETMAVGTPFVGTNVGNTSTLPGGIVIDDITDMCKAIDDLYFDSKKYKLLSQKGKKYAYKNCRANVAVEKLIKLIEGM